MMESSEAMCLVVASCTAHLESRNKTFTTLLSNLVLQVKVLQWAEIEFLLWLQFLPVGSSFYLVQISILFFFDNTECILISKYFFLFHFEYGIIVSAKGLFFYPLCLVLIALKSRTAG